MGDRERDLSIIELYKKGEEKAFEELVKIYSSSIYNFSRRFVSKDESQDLVSETFIKVWKNLNKFDENKSSFKTWIFTIAHNTIFDFLRKRKILTFSELDGVYKNSNDTEGQESFVENIPDENLLPDKQLEKLEDINFLNKILGELSVVDRDILVLHYQEDMTFDEIGKILNLSVNTVKSKHRRILIQLRKIILL